MNDCPLFDKTVGDTTCGSCMYRDTQGGCLHGTADTTEFARARGVKPSEVDVERVKAEQRILAGLLLYEYLSWLRSHVAIAEGVANSVVTNLLMTTPLYEMGITPDELAALIVGDNWETFCTANKVDTPFRLAQVLLMTEQQFSTVSDDASI